MGRVRGDREASASRTNSCGMAFRRLAEKGDESGGRMGELRRDCDMRRAAIEPGDCRFQQLRYISGVSRGECSSGEFKTRREPLPDVSSLAQRLKPELNMALMAAANRCATSKAQAKNTPSKKANLKHTPARNGAI